VVIAVVVLVLALAAVLAWALRLAQERRELRDMLSAPADLPTAVALKRLLRTTVHRDLLSAARFSRESVMEACPLPVLAIDPDVRVARANAAAEAAFGGPIGGRLVEEVSAVLHDASAAVLGGPPVANVELRGPDGRIWLASLRSYPAGPDRAAVAVLSDVSERVDYREARRVFSAAVSHELRTPLQRIRGLVETLGLPLDDSERQELTDAVQDEVVHMRELIDEMLLLAALDRGEGAIAEADTDAGEVAAMVVEDRRERAESAGMHLSVVASPGLSMPIAEALLRVVIGNVLDNAIKHAGAGAEIEVAVRGRAGEVEIGVADDGVGIAEDHLPHVFERFFRGDASRATPGTGLGLAIVKHVVEAHGGRVMLSSRPGEGTHVRLLVPEAPVPVIREPGWTPHD
jgi:signal transduction histidine kinase